MQWHSASEFFAMGGYAGYVWGSMGACALAMAVESWMLRRRHRRLVHALRRRDVRTGDTGIPRQPGVSQREGIA